MGFRIGAFSVVLSCVAVLWTLTASAGAAEGVECGSVITEDTVLTHDLLDCENGLTVAAPGVTLDLGGHQIGGRGTGSGVSVGAQGAVVRNGAVTGFSTGVLGLAAGATVSHLVVSSNGSGVFGAGAGVDLLVENSTIRGNTNDGVTMYLGGASIARVVDSRILDNGGTGINYFDASGLLQGNLVMRNGASGISGWESHMIAIGNTSSNNGGAGIALRDPVPGHLNLSRIGANLANGNEGLGIYVETYGFTEPTDLLDAGGNAANRNGDPRECTVVACARNRGQATPVRP